MNRQGGRWRGKGGRAAPTRATHQTRSSPSPISRGVAHVPRGVPTRSHRQQQRSAHLLGQSGHLRLEQLHLALQQQREGPPSPASPGTIGGGGGIQHRLPPQHGQQGSSACQLPPCVHPPPHSHSRRQRGASVCQLPACAHPDPHPGPPPLAWRWCRAAAARRIRSRIAQYTRSATVAEATAAIAATSPTTLATCTPPPPLPPGANAAAIATGGLSLVASSPAPFMANARMK